MNHSVHNLSSTEKSILDEVSACVNKLRNEGNTSSKQWTSQLKEALYKLGNKHGYQAWGSNSKDSNEEFLWDVCWAEVYGNSWKSGFRKLHLACEIEWASSRNHDTKDPLIGLPSSA